MRLRVYRNSILVAADFVLIKLKKKKRGVVKDYETFINENSILYKEMNGVHTEHKGHLFEIMWDVCFEGTIKLVEFIAKGG
jgi:hypothetical protein